MQSGSATRVADAQAGEAGRLREGAQHHHLAALPDVGERVGEVGALRELDVGLVEDDDGARRAPAP